MFNVSSVQALILWVLVLGIAPGVQALTDPTQPSNYRTATKEPSLHLESVLSSEHRKVAVINGVVLSVGERIGSARVVAITENTVKLRRGGKEFSLQLKRASIRQEK